jgi:hypothetical protein
VDGSRTRFASRDHSVHHALKREPIEDGLIGDDERAPSVEGNIGENRVSPSGACEEDDGDC